jgi:hypothetical protein
VPERPCDGALRRGRMINAERFLEAAEVVATDPRLANPAVANCVDAGIAAADVICCATLGVHHHGPNHNDAVAMLVRVDKRAARHLDTLLGHKSAASYTGATMTATQVSRALRAATALVDAARRM